MVFSCQMPCSQSPFSPQQSPWSAHTIVLRRSPRLTRLCSPRLTPLIIRMSMHETACA